MTSFDAVSAQSHFIFIVHSKNLVSRSSLMHDHGWLDTAVVLHFITYVFSCGGKSNPLGQKS